MVEESMELKRPGLKSPRPRLKYLATKKVMVGKFVVEGLMFEELMLDG